MNKKTFRVNHVGNLIEVEIGQNFTIFRCGSGRAIFGESAFLERSTKKHLVFKTESGSIVKTEIDNLHAVVGKARKEGYVVSPNLIDNFDNLIKSKVKFWDDKKLEFVYK